MSGCFSNVKDYVEDDTHIRVRRETSKYKYYTVQSTEEYGGFWKEDISVENGKKTKLSNMWVTQVIVDKDEKLIAFKGRIEPDIYMLEVETDKIKSLLNVKGSPIHIYNGWLYFRDEKERNLKRVYLDIDNDFAVETVFEHRFLNIEKGESSFTFEDSNGETYTIDLDELN